MNINQLEWVAGFCDDHLLDEKWLLGPSLRVVNQWKEQIAFSGTKVVNLHPKTIRAIVLQLATERLDELGMEFASPVLSRLLVRKILGEKIEACELEYLGQAVSLDKIADLATKTIDQFRLAGLNVDQISEDAWEEKAKFKDFASILKAYEAGLQSNQLADYAVCLNLLLSTPKLVEQLQSNVKLLLPYELDLHRREIDLLELFEEYGLAYRLESGNAAVSISVKPKFDFFAATGEVNEVRAVLQRLLASDDAASLDSTEILHTDYESYVPLIHEYFARLATDDLSIDAIPVTFAEGIACIYSRPGRALRSWLRWIRNRCLQPQLVQMIREGLLSFESDDAQQKPSNTRLADALRKISIGMDLDRYLPKLDDAIAIAERCIEAAKEDDDGDQRSRDYGLANLRTLRTTVAVLAECSPAMGDPPQDVLNAAKLFLGKLAQASSKLDKYARQKLLDEVDGMLVALRYSPELELDVWQWLEDLPVNCRILGSGPRPGCVHVDHILSGGHSGRPNLFVIGMDDSRFPKRGQQDPLLLDIERKHISPDLKTSAEYNRRCVRRFSELMKQPAQRIALGYSVRSLKIDRLQFVSPLLLDVYRDATDSPDAALEDFLQHVGNPVSFASDDLDSLATMDEWWTSSLLSMSDANGRRHLVEDNFLHIGAGRSAAEAVASMELTPYDGLVPSAAAELDPTQSAERRASPSRLETLGKCPRKFFFRYGLKMYPPDELVLDKDRWIDPLVLGNLVHEVFEEFLLDLTAQKEVPSLSRDKDLLLAVMRRKIESLKQDFPIPNEDAYRRQVSQLEKTCEIFLRAEERYCKRYDAKPWVLEGSLGLNSERPTALDCDDPVEVHLSDGRRLHLSGRIDRVDRLGDSASSLAIWDYKTGSNFGFDKADPFQKGTKLQSFLYVGMLQHRARQVLGSEAKVTQFGYFFPSPRANGFRIHWTTGELKTGDAVLRQVCDVITSSAFLGTTDPDECRYCDYLSICGDRFETAARSKWMLQSPGNEQLDALRILKEIASVGEVPDHD